jgi:hypothetical protein
MHKEERNPMVTEKIVDKIKKLLRLAESADVNEAANAAGAAQRLMEEHRIDQAMIDIGETDGDGMEPEEVREFGEEPLEASGRLAQWKCQLAVALSGVNACRCYLGKEYAGRKTKTKLCLVGRPSDVSTVRYLFEYLTSEVSRLCAKEGVGQGRTWANSFRMGAVHTIRRRLHEANQQAREAAKLKLKGKGTTALVRLDQALAMVDQRSKQVDAWMKENMKLGSARSSRSRRDYDAYAAGKRAGNSINLSGPSDSLKSGSKALGSGGK